jgi:hypothetical protein
VPNDARVVLWHATSRENARAILRHGWDPTKKVWGNSDPDYIYLGAKQGLGTYLGPHISIRRVGGEIPEHDILAARYRCR